METIFNAVARWWRNGTSARANVAMLNRCGAEESGRIAHDVGVSSSEFRFAGKWPDSADLLNSRFIAFDLDPVDLERTQPQVLADLQRACAMCVNDRRCHHDLDRDPSDPVWRKYCPNARTLDALKAKRA